MYRNFRPEPLSPSRPKVNRDLIIPEQMRLMSLSPNLYDRNQLRSPKLIDSISNMKIFNEENDKGGPDKLWNDNINRVHHPKPINYDVIHSVTFKPDQLNPSSMNSIFFNRRKSRKSPSANHKNSQNSQNDEDKRNIVYQANTSSPPEIKMRVKRNKLHSELNKTTVGETFAKTNDENTIEQSSQALNNEGEDDQSDRKKYRGSMVKEGETIAKATNKLMAKTISDLK